MYSLALRPEVVSHLRGVQYKLFGEPGAQDKHPLVFGNFSGGQGCTNSFLLR